jgi:putative transcriptional regulator
VVTALIDFTPLWETMRRKQVTQYQLLKNGLDNKTLDTLKKNRNITLCTESKNFQSAADGPDRCLCAGAWI